MSDKPCTCHPDDNPPVPCPQKFALSECRAAAPAPHQEAIALLREMKAAPAPAPADDTAKGIMALITDLKNAGEQYGRCIVARHNVLYAGEKADAAEDALRAAIDAAIAAKGEA